MQEKFLTEQHQLLSQCLTERHSLAAERAQLTVLQRKASEREQREVQRNQEVGREGKNVQELRGDTSVNSGEWCWWVCMYT